MKELMMVIVEVENMKKGEENVIMESWKKI
jgi:hypothetical protein